MKKNKTKTKANTGRARQKSSDAAKTPKTQSAADAALVPTDIRKAYKNRLISAYFNRPH